MRLLPTHIIILCVLFLLHCCLAANYQPDLSDNEFAEFEDFEAEDDSSITDTEDFPEVPAEIPAQPQQQVDDDDQDIIIDDDDSEFEHFHDVEEFEGFEVKDEKIEGEAEPKITIANVPLQTRLQWESYYLEIIMGCGLMAYFWFYFRGKAKNDMIANLWFQTHRQLLEENFSVVGDDGNIERMEDIGLVKESENVFTLWCSGRSCCEGMLVELKLIKRQDLLSVLSGFIRPTTDQIHIQIQMNKDDMDSFVFCVASKKTATYLSKEAGDLNTFCPERKSGEKFNLPASFNVLSEIPEATSAILDSKITTALNKYPDLIDYIHFSDQYTGVKVPEEERNLKLPDTEKVLLFGFNIKPGKKDSIEDAMIKLKPLMNMVFYSVDKVKRFRLTKEGKFKADKNRQRVEEAFLKSTHHARAEAAAARREEKRRQEKEKVLADDDPERQRRWELKEEKRQAKKRAPKMKQLKVKAL